MKLREWPGRVWQVCKTALMTHCLVKWSCMTLHGVTMSFNWIPNWIRSVCQKLKLVFTQDPLGDLVRKQSQLFGPNVSGSGMYRLKRLKSQSLVRAGANKDLYNFGWQMGAWWECCILESDMRKAKRGPPRRWWLWPRGSSAALEQRAMLTLVSLHNAQVFRLLLKTSVERNKHELNLFLAGFALWLSLMKLWKVKELSRSEIKCPQRRA